MVDGFLGLRHDTVVGRHDDDGDVGDVSAPSAHLRECLVARRVEEGHRSAVVIDAPGADYLRNAARLRRGDVAIQQRRLAVVNVAHDGDDRGPQHQLLRVVGTLKAGQQQLLRVGRPLDFQFAAGLQGNRLRHHRIQGGVNVGRLRSAVAHQTEQ